MICVHSFSMRRLWRLWRHQFDVMDTRRHQSTHRRHHPTGSLYDTNPKSLSFKNIFHQKLQTQSQRRQLIIRVSQSLQPRAPIMKPGYIHRLSIDSWYVRVGYIKHLTEQRMRSKNDINRPCSSFSDREINWRTFVSQIQVSVRTSRGFDESCWTGPQRTLQYSHFKNTV